MTVTSAFDRAFVLMPDGKPGYIVTGSVLTLNRDGSLTILPPASRLVFQNGRKIEEPPGLIRTYWPDGRVSENASASGVA